jgi:hypothetical protein
MKIAAAIPQNVSSFWGLENGNNVFEPPSLNRALRVESIPPVFE